MLKYRWWNNELQPFRLLKRRVANIFRKRNALSDDSRRMSTQTLVNQIDSDEERSILNNDRRDSVHSDWSDLMPVNAETEYKKIYKEGKELNTDRATTSTASVTNDLIRPSAPLKKKTIKNIVLVPYTPKLKDWGSWRIKSPHATSTIDSPPLTSNDQRKDDEMVYVPHSPYYSPVHPPEFYEDE